MKIIQATSRWLYRRAENFVALLLGSMFVSFLIQIVFRYALNLPLGWTVEYVAIAWLWGILFCYAFVTRDDEIIRLDLLYGLLPRPAQRVLDVVTNLTCAAIFLWSLPKVYEFVTFMGIERTAYMQIRFDLVFSIYVPFAFVVAMRSLYAAWRALIGDPVTIVRTVSVESHDYD